MSDITFAAWSSPKEALAVHLGSHSLLLIGGHCSALIYRQETILHSTRTEMKITANLQISKPVNKNQAW